ncbi:hypothetical protein, partial [Micromonospora aurantiaca (nom. illeg.)]|uniref:hypothetical protein n=1 Tax=Micromonospora aurantiaca (nom. illeg.) TaxID=47850 RepID=UPI003F4A02D6
SPTIVPVNLAGVTCDDVLARVRRIAGEDWPELLLSRPSRLCSLGISLFHLPYRPEILGLETCGEADGIY